MSASRDELDRALSAAYSEIDTLRAQVNEWAGKWEKAISAGAVMEGERDTLRSQLAEAHTLLRRAYRVAPPELGRDIQAVLSASAEPLVKLKDVTFVSERSEPSAPKCGVCDQGAWACNEGGCHYLESGNGSPVERSTFELPHYLKLSDAMREAGEHAEKRAIEDGCYSVPVLKAVFFEAAIQCWLDDQEVALSASAEPSAPVEHLYPKCTVLKDASVRYSNSTAPVDDIPICVACTLGDGRDHGKSCSLGLPVERGEREAFEKAVIDKAERFHPNLEQYGEHPDAEYRDASIEWAWGLWKARAALERKP